MEEKPKKETLYRKFLKALRIIEEPRAKRRQVKGSGKDVAIPVAFEEDKYGLLGPKKLDDDFSTDIAVEPAELGSNELTSQSAEEARSCGKDKTGTEDDVECTNVSDNLERKPKADEENVKLDDSHSQLSIAESRAAKPKSFFKLIKHRPSME